MPKIQFFAVLVARGTPLSIKEEKPIMTEVSIVFVTVGNMEEAVRIGRALVEERLAACANIIPQVRSVYRWKGEICDDQECLMVLKTESTVFPDLQERIRRLHSYEVPEIIAFPIAQGLPEYLAWVMQNVGEQAGEAL